MPEDTSYEAASRRLLEDGFRLNPRTCCFERGEERLTLRWNGRVYARRPPRQALRGYMLMPVYTLVITADDGHQHTTLSEFPDDRTAIGDTGHVVTSEHPSIAVARGFGEDVEFLGAWDWRDGAACWTAEE